MSFACNASMYMKICLKSQPHGKAIGNVLSAKGICCLQKKKKKTDHIELKPFHIVVWKWSLTEFQTLPSSLPAVHYMTNE